METFGLFLVTLLLNLLNAFGFSRLFQKAKKDSWKAYVPVLNSLTLYEITGRSKFEVILEFIPFINLYVYFRNIIDTLNCFGEQSFLQKTAAAIVAPVYLPIFAAKEHVSYLGTLDSLPRPVITKSPVREWLDAVTFAVIAATLIRWLIMEAYTIPTPSMENSLLVGDFLFVSKFHYGTRTPKTILQIPLTHQKIWFTEIPSYLTWIQLPQYRLPGISHVKREDVVVFNVPPRELNDYKDYPVDLKTNYIKRCVGIPGDVITVKDKQVVVNGQPLNNPPNMQFKYLVYAKDEINERNLIKLQLDPDDYESGFARTVDNKVVYEMFLTKEKAEELKGIPYIAGVVQDTRTSTDFDPRIFPHLKGIRWTGDNYGPVTVPKKGMTISINDSTLAFYGATILNYDHNDKVEVTDSTLSIDGKMMTSYTFKQDYYFMMGDNRHNSLDSRYWGFVPEDHIVGKAFFIWLSIDKYGDFLNKIRWSRFFNLIR